MRIIAKCTANMHIEPNANGTTYVSYETPVAAMWRGKYYESSKRYSNTTVAHKSRFRLIAGVRYDQVIEVTPEQLRDIINGRA